MVGKKASYPPVEAVYTALRPHMDEQLATYLDPTVADKGKVGELVQLWEKNHPGESFIPAADEVSAKGYIGGETG